MMMQGGGAIPLKKIKLEAVDRSIAVNSVLDSSTAANSAAEKMNRIQLRAYAGTYTLMSQFDLKVFVDGGKLMAHATGQGAFEIEAKGKDRFAADAYGIEIQFKRYVTAVTKGAAGGTVKRLALLQRCNTMRGDKK